MIHPQLQPHSKTIKQIEGQERMEMEKRTSRSIRRTQREDYESTGPLFTKERGKIQSRNRCVRTRYRKSIISRAGWKMETNSFLVKNDASSRMKL